MGRISHVWGLVLTFKWSYFPNAGRQEGLSTLNSWQGIGRCILSSGELIKPLREMASEECQSLFRLGEDIWIWTPKLGSLQLDPLVAFCCTGPAG